VTVICKQCDGAYVVKPRGGF